MLKEKSKKDQKLSSLLVSECVLGVVLLLHQHAEQYFPPSLHHQQRWIFILS